MSNSTAEGEQNYEQRTILGSRWNNGDVQGDAESSERRNVSDRERNVSICIMEESQKNTMKFLQLGAGMSYRKAREEVTVEL